MYRIALLLALFAALSPVSMAQQSGQAKAATGPSEFKIGGAVSTPMTVTAEDLKKMPRKTLRVEMLMPSVQKSMKAWRSKRYSKKQAFRKANKCGELP